MDTNNNMTPGGNAQINNIPPNTAPNHIYPGGAPYVPPEYRPISTWGYFGYELLFAIPLIGFILLIVFAVSSTNINLRNFARSYFCYLIILAILLILLMATGVGATIISSLM